MTNSYQLEAVLAIHGPMFIIAGYDYCKALLIDWTI